MKKDQLILLQRLTQRKLLRSMRIKSQKKMQMLQMQMAAPILRLKRQQIFHKIYI